jgi:hypothetical protein
MKWILLTLVVTASLLTGCSKQAENSDKSVKTTQDKASVDVKKIGKNTLLSWKGKYPTNQGQNIFDELDLKPILSSMLTEKIFKKIYTEFTLETPIRIIDNHLLIFRGMPHDASSFNAMIAINIDNGEMSVYWFDGKVSLFFSKNHITITDRILFEFISTHNMDFREFYNY